MALRLSANVLPRLLSTQRIIITRTVVNTLKTSGVDLGKFSTADRPSEPCYENEVVSLPCIKKLIEGSNIQLIDVRSREEIEETGKIPGSTNIPLDEVKDAFSLSTEEFEEKYKVPKPKPDDESITFHCRSGKRAQNAIKIIQELGYVKAHNFTGGWVEWQKAMETDLTSKDSR